MTGSEGQSDTEMASGIAPGIRVGHIQYNDAFAYDSDTCEDAVSSATSSEVAHVVDESFLPRILALFFAIFHPTEGPKVVYQVPEGSVTAEEVGDTKAKGQRCKGPSTPGVESTQRDAFLEQEQLFDFENLSEYLIPKAPLCGKLITCTIKGLRSRNSRGTRREGEPLNYCQRSSQKRASSGVQRYYKVLSHPVLLQDSNKYERNTFIFNLAFVFDGKADVKSYEPVVRKCARTLKDLEASSLAVTIEAIDAEKYLKQLSTSESSGISIVFVIPTDATTDVWRSGANVSRPQFLLRVVSRSSGSLS